jgi:formate dehydrogenase maturation protein FdhE
MVLRLKVLCHCHVCNLAQLTFVVVDSKEHQAIKTAKCKQCNVPLVVVEYPDVNGLLWQDKQEGS